MEEGRVSDGIRTQRAQRTRERILDAAAHEFSRHGVSGTRVADIAARAGIAYGLVYHHFHNKEEILSAIFQQRWGGYVDFLESLVVAHMGVAEWVGRLSHYWIESYRVEPDVMAVMINEVTRSFAFVESHGLTDVMRAFDAVDRRIALSQEQGEIAPTVDRQLATYAVLGVADMVLAGYVTGTLVRHNPEELHHDELQIAAFIVKALSADPGPTMLLHDGHTGHVSPPSR